MLFMCMLLPLSGLLLPFVPLRAVCSWPTGLTRIYTNARMNTHTHTHAPVYT